MEYATPEADADAPVLVARLSHIRGMLGVLQTVKQTKKQARRWACTLRACYRGCNADVAARAWQLATLVANSQGLMVYTYDDSRVVQACAHFKREARTPGALGRAAC